MRQPVKSVTLERQITRADGTVEPQEVVSYWHRNPLRRLQARLRGIKGKVKVHARSSASPGA